MNYIFVRNGPGCNCKSGLATPQVWVSIIHHTKYHDSHFRMHILYHFKSEFKIKSSFWFFKTWMVIVEEAQFQIDLTDWLWSWTVKHLILRENDPICGSFLNLFAWCHCTETLNGPRPIFRAKKYNVINKQTDTVALFSGH